MTDLEREELATAVYDRLDEKTQALIAIAAHDLECGPIPKGEVFNEGEKNETAYPGFLPACRCIREALDEIGDIYLIRWVPEIVFSRPEEDEEYMILKPEEWKRMIWPALSRYIL